MKKEEILERLKNDEDYYGSFGKQYLSYSHMSSLLSDPADFQKDYDDRSSAFVIGGFLHTLVLEPGKVDNYTIIDSSTRNTKKYKEESEGKNNCLLLKEAEKCYTMRDSLMINNDIAKIVHGPRNEYEVPMIGDIEGEMFKGKADILHPDFILDLKTTNDISKFHKSGYIYNYDMQAYVYTTLFNRPMSFVAIDKTTYRIGLFHTSEEFLERGRIKLLQAIDIYREYHKDKKYDFSQYYIEQTL